MSSIDFSGVHTALITPMKNGQVAYPDLGRLIKFQLNEGINGLVPVGTTGESATLEQTEHLKVIRYVVQQVKGRVPVIAGTGSNSTAEAIHLTQKADQAGADAFLHVAPYYNKPSQEGLFQHFSQVASITKKPIILYSIPSRCGISIEIETVARLYRKHPNICAIKEAGGSAERVSQLRQVLGSRYTILSGDDSLTIPFMSVGAKGVISVASNLVVKDLVKMVDLALKNDFCAAEKLHRKYYPLFKNIFIEPNPVPIKEALYRTKIIQSSVVRPPLCPMSTANRATLLNTLKKLGYKQLRKK